MKAIAYSRSAHISRFLSICVATSMLGLYTKTLRRRDAMGQLKPIFRTPYNHGRYDRRHILLIIHHRSTKIAPYAHASYLENCSLNAAIYTRVSSSRQKTSDELAWNK